MAASSGRGPGRAGITGMGDGGWGDGVGLKF